MSDDLITWLRAQLDEDERLAKAATGGGWYAADMSIRGKTHLNGNDVLVVRHTWPQESDHIIRHDPVRVLAEVEAKRAILDAHATEVAELSAFDEWGAGRIEAYEIAIRHLGVPYADREGYREEWRP